MQSLRFLADVFASEGCDQHDGGLAAKRLVVLNVATGLEAVQSGHSPIHEDDVVRRGGISTSDGREGFFSGPDGIDVADDGAERFLKNFARGGIIIDDEHAQFCQSFGNNFAGGLCVADFKPNGETERTADARFTFGVHTPGQGGDYPFPTNQSYSDNSTVRWDGPPGPDAPAPVLKVT